jgi:predicted phosphodiesterase
MTELTLPSLTTQPLPIVSATEPDRSPIKVATKKALLLYDIHIPYHAALPVSIALSVGKAAGVDTLIFGGDTMDFYMASDYVKDPRRRSLASEAESVRAFLADVRSIFKKEQIYYMEGNHEYRLKNYMRTRADKLIGLPGTTLETLLALDELKIKLVQDKRRLLIGSLNVLHGHEFPNIGAGINPARSLFMKAKSSSIIGHCHRKSEHSEVTLNGGRIACWSVGCLCNLSPDYFPYNNWVWGFAIVEVDKSGHYTVHNKYISNDGKVY